MKNHINYLTNLLDFIVMQRTSFCWFISEGISGELIWFSRIYNFTKSFEYIVFGEEYSLIKPPSTSNVVRKYEGNFRTRLIIPMEMRFLVKNKKISRRIFRTINLPLMSIYATFILNGCERVVVNQIIRSPGVYFEKQKTLKNLPSFQRKVSSDLSKLHLFIPSGEINISNSDLFFNRKMLIFDHKYDEKELNVNEELAVKFFWSPIWNSIPIRSFSLTLLRKNKNNFSFYFLQNFKFYQIIINEINIFHKQQLILFLFRWLKITISKKNKIRKIQSIIFLLDSFNLLLLLNLKHNLLIEKNKSESVIINSSKFTKQLSNIYFETLIYIQKLLRIELNQKWILILYPTMNLRYKLKNFSFLKINIIESIKFIKNSKKLIGSKELEPAIYFSKSLKSNFKYIFEGKFQYKFQNNITKLSKRHKYLKSKTQLLLFNKDHNIKTSYQIKYDKKDLYGATLIPEYGSWIRFKFQKHKIKNLYQYPLKYQKEDLIIELDRINSRLALFFLKEIGFNDVLIYHNLEQSDFFYESPPILYDSHSFNKPSLRFNFYLSSKSNFSQIFSPLYYRLGKIGRIQLNKKLNLNISHRLQTITYEDIFAIIDQLLTLTISFSLIDDIDHLKNRRVRSSGELLQSLLRIGFQRLKRKFLNKSEFDINIINTTIQEFFSSSQLSQYLDQTNPLASLTHRRRISALGPGGLNRERISFSIRDIHPSHYGRICPIETPEGKNVGLVSALTTCARINKLGFLETPFWRVINGKILKFGRPIYLTADVEDLYKIAPPDITADKNNYIIQNNIPTRYKQDFLNLFPGEIDFVSISPVQIVSIATALIPFFEHDDANRALMGANMQRQSVPLLLPQKPIVGTGFENQIASDSGASINACDSGVVENVDASQIIIKIKNGIKVHYELNKYLRSNQQTCINHRPIVWVGEDVQSGQMLTDGPSLSMNELSLGQNVLISYVPWQGYNFEDAVLISERLVYDNIFSSIHIERYKMEFNETIEGFEKITKNIPNLKIENLKNLDYDGIVKVGTYVVPGDILVGKVSTNISPKQVPESKLLRAIFGEKSNNVKDSSFRMPNGCYGRVIENIVFYRRINKAFKYEKVYTYVGQIRKIQVGDKIAGRHGNKGIISRILSRQDMPFLPDGTSVDIVLNPLGVPSRMNVGQIYECLLGLVGHKLNCRFKILPFDESYGIEMSRILINKKLRNVSILKNESWLYNPYVPGKMVLIDGRTGKEFENPITVGNAYMLKLIHLVEDKMHSRSTGPYSLVTQQPLRGKAQQGGQRFGEMEVWALEGFGAAFTLRELLTIKSDDVYGRDGTVITIVRGQQVFNLGIPESFKVLLQELRSIGLDMRTYVIEKFSFNGHYIVETNLIETYNSTSKFFDSEIDINDIKF